MFEEYQICPYTGLRSFTEEESLYFKGREEHIEQATEQLQRNKFLMLTGASGDGKSSLVYAGIVPNARAGFLKSKYTQWSVADFRPERTPFKNLCRSVARQLGIANAQIVESELQHGFSALVDLYKNSKSYVDVDSIAWQQADDQQRAMLKRNASNLMIIVDQFEEFFTNPENYRHGVPSADANLVLNVLLETSRIALEEDLPIYIVFTMRSDYIGQCAAFRSLPEYIGFSQFFVPRLNRSQLQLVIEEPAMLSGNRISRRLTERLIHDIAEGVDQLPILQHALNQIWHAANQGNDEMDLIHYAMVGGMPPSELPDDKAHEFRKWFADQPENLKQFYNEPNLQNVLDTHANKLYESAGAYYNASADKKLSDETIKEIVRTTFTCLTKIDQSRAVRNRMTLHEIYSILNRSDVDIATVGKVLNIFREPGNTFIRPFITDDPESNNLAEDAVLDITHESLIRNWEYLEQWAKEEFDNYSVSLDFKKQVDRWVESNQSNDFLLSMGPLTYFENWYTKVRPNAWWIARYLPEDIDPVKKQENSETTLRNTQEFLKRSARKHAVTRTIVRVGPRRIAAGLAVLVLLTLSSFALRNYVQQQNDYVLKSIKQQSLALANSNKVDGYQKSMLLAENLKTGHATITEIVKGVEDSVSKINVVNRLAAVLVIQGRNDLKPEILESLLVSDSLFKGFSIEKAGAEKTAQLLKEVNYLRAALELAVFYNPSAELKALRKQNAERSAALVKHILKLQPENFTDVNGLNASLENAINHHAFTNDDLQQLLQTLSPFENATRSAWVENKYAQDKLAIRGRFQYGYKFNGLYQQLAYLYAVQGKTDKVLQCIDSLLTYNQSYYENNYTAMADNAANIAVVFYSNDQTTSLDAFVRGYCLRKKMTAIEFFQRLIGRMNVSESCVVNLDERERMISNLNAEFGTQEMITFFFAQYRKCIEQTAPDADARNFYLALSWKDEAMVRLTRMKSSGQQAGRENLFKMFDTAVEFYNKVSKEYLNQQIIAAKLSDTDAAPVPRKFLFIYPDYRTTFNPFEPRNYYFFYHNEAFIEYILEHNLFDTFYNDERSIGIISGWIEMYFACMIDPVFGLRQKADTAVLIRLEKKITQRKAQLPHINFLYSLLGIEAYETGNTELALTYYRKIEVDKISNLLRYPADGANREVFSILARVVTGLTGTGNFNEAYPIIKVFKNPINRSSIYAFAAVELLRKKSDSPIVQQLIDSARIELTRIENLSTDQPNRILIAHALEMQDPDKNLPETNRMIKNIGNKYWPTLRISRSYAFHGDLYQAQQSITENSSDGDQTEFLWNILYGYADGQDTKKKDWEGFDSAYPWTSIRVILYINEDN